MNISKHNIKSYFFGNPGVVADKILFIKREARLDEYKEQISNVQEFGNVWRGITGLFQGERITIIVTGVGPGVIGDATYALNKPDAVCLYSGTCGGLNETLEIGDYFIANEAVCGDGYTFHLRYLPFTEVSGDFKFLNSLKSTIIKKAERLHTGTSFTTNSVVRETEDGFWKCVSEKCRAIEMGVASYYAAAGATEKRAAAYFWVSDLPTRGKSFFKKITLAKRHSNETRPVRSVRYFRP